VTDKLEEQQIFPVVKEGAVQHSPHPIAGLTVQPVCEGWVLRVLMGQLIVSALQEPVAASNQQHCPCTALLWGIACPGQGCPSAHHPECVWDYQLCVFLNSHCFVRVISFLHYPG